MKAGIALKYIFTEEDKAKELNVVLIEQDNVLLKGESLVKEDDGFIITGTAVIDDETYHDFEVFFVPKNDIDENDIESLMKAEWDWYDYIC